MNLDEALCIVLAYRRRARLVLSPEVEAVVQRAKQMIETNALNTMRRETTAVPNGERGDG